MKNTLGDLNNDLFAQLEKLRFGGNMDKTKIDWCDSTWNPVTGCLHGCEYCYARGIAKRFSYEGTTLDAPPELQRRWIMDSVRSGAGNRVLRYPVDTIDGKRVPYPFGFMPTFHKYRLNEYQNKKSRNIFVCSMADLFGEWVPDEWIEEVFEACDNAPQHNYLFLTKNPKRYEKVIDRYMPPNMWFGWSQTGPMGNKCDFTTHHSIKTFISIEPLLEPFKEFHIRGINWVIIGAETGRRKNRVVPERKWIGDIANECRKFNIPVFMKSSLADIWGEPLIQEFPVELRHEN